MSLEQWVREVITVPPLLGVSDRKRLARIQLRTALAALEEEDIGAAIMFADDAMAHMRALSAKVD
jgi:hypothetical protein